MGLLKIFNIFLPLEERNKILYEFNNNTFEYNQNKLYNVEFSKVAKMNPNKCAIICNNIKYSYEEIDEMSNSLAHLLRKQSIQRNVIFPVISERSHYYVIASLSIMKSGAAFLPIDSDFPEERKKYIIKDVNTKIILYFITNEKNKSKFINEDIDKYNLNLHNYKENRNDIENINVSSDTCYSLFISGTTVKPKDVLISHNSLINFIYYSQSIKGYNNLDEYMYTNTLAFSKFTFDMSINEIFYSLLKEKIYNIMK